MSSAVRLLLLLAAVLAAAVEGASVHAARNGLIAVAVIDQQSETWIRLFQPDWKPAGTLRVQPYVDLPRFSPDGRWLAFWGGPDPDRAVPWVADADGHHPRALLPVPDARDPALEYWLPPIWGPNGQLAYVDEHAPVGSDRYQDTIHVVQVAGNVDRILQLGRSVPRSFSLIDWQGNHMILGDRNDHGYQLLDLRRRTVERLPGPASLSPDGSSVAYIRSGTLFVLDLIAHRTRRLALVTGAETVPTVPVWSPDSTAVAFGRKHRVYVVASMGGEPHAVASRTKDILWSPDGQALLTDAYGYPGLMIDHMHSNRKNGVRLDLTGDFGMPIAWQPR